MPLRFNLKSLKPDSPVPKEWITPISVNCSKEPPTLPKLTPSMMESLMPPHIKEEFLLEQEAQAILRKPKAWVLREDTGKITEVGFRCPGCNQLHRVAVNNRRDKYDRTYGWNQSLKRPTFLPVHVNYKDTENECHASVHDGFVHFQPGSKHDKVDCTLEIPDVEE